MERYAAARPDVFFTGADGSLRSNRVLCQLAGQYAIDMFIGSSLQIDGEANSSTVTDGRLSGFGGAPNMGHDPHGRRHASPAWLSLLHGEGADAARAQAGGADRPDLPVRRHAHLRRDRSTRSTSARHAGMPMPPVMIYGDDVSHVVTEEGVAYLYKAPRWTTAATALAAIAGVTPIGPARGRDARPSGCAATGWSPFPRTSGSSPAGQPLAAGRPQHRGPGRLVRRPVRPARAVPGLVSAMLVAEPRFDPALRDTPLLPPPRHRRHGGGGAAGRGRSSPRSRGWSTDAGSGAHTDMNLAMLLASAEALRERVRRMRRRRPQDLPLGTAPAGQRSAVIGRAGEQHDAAPRPAGSTPTAARCGRWACWPPASPAIEV